MTKIALLDGDMYAYRCAVSTEPTKDKPERESLDEAIFRLNDFLYRTIDTCAASEYRIFISGGGNFRKLLYPLYKANRAKLPRPAYLDTLRELLVREWDAEICDGYEADDGIGMAHSEHTIICSNDKDFRQLGGEIFNPVKSEFEVVSEDEAALSFWTQMLTGDSSDGVPGVGGLGPVKARRALDGCPTEELYSRVFNLYGDSKRFLLHYRLLKICTSQSEYDNIRKELDDLSSSEESQGEELTEASSEEDSGFVPGANVE